MFCDGEMKRYFKNQQGISLLELVLVIMLIGIALPSLLSIVGVIASYHARSELMQHSMNLADSRMEEIMAFKNENWDWYKSINDFVGEEVLEGQYHRLTTVTYHDNWNDSGFDAYEVTIRVTHSGLPEGFVLTVHLTKYN